MTPDKLPLPQTFSVVAKPNSRKSEVIGWNSEKKELKVAIAAHAEHNKANVELLKFLRKISGRSAEIVSGLKSKRKIIRLG
jgi:hypothetical protein